MPGLIPLGGGGVPPPTCFRCGELAVGPCAICRVMICAGEECSVVAREVGLPPVVLCRSCEGHRSALTASVRSAPILVIAGLALLLVLLATGAASFLAGLGYLLSLLLLLLALALALARRRWRSRLSEARRVPQGPA